jgi:serine/threonine-protein kinase
LHCAHSQNVWHRDIKPGNLILTAEGQLKVADFGIARIDAHVLTQEAWSMGSPGYMAPECYTGTEIDHRVDLYACGVLLFELLTGCRPFHGSPGAVMYQTIHEEPPPMGQVLRGAAELSRFEVIVARAMAKQRDQRYTSATEMRDALHIVAHSLAIDIPSRVNAATVQTLVRSLPAQRLQERPAISPPMSGPTTSPPRSSDSSADATAAKPPGSGDVAAPFHLVLAQLLQAHLGPMAGIVVKQAAARHPGAAALVAHLANELPDAQDRRNFLLQAQKAHPHVASPVAPAAVLPVLGTTTLADALVAQATPMLVQQVGPIGALLVKRAAKDCSTREAFLHALADDTADLVDRDQLLRKLNRLQG